MVDRKHDHHIPIVVLAPNLIAAGIPEPEMEHFLLSDRQPVVVDMARYTVRELFLVDGHPGDLRIEFPVIVVFRLHRNRRCSETGAHFPAGLYRLLGGGNISIGCQLGNTGKSVSELEPIRSLHIQGEIAGHHKRQIPVFLRFLCVGQLILQLPLIDLVGHIRQIPVFLIPHIVLSAGGIQQALVLVQILVVIGGINLHTGDIVARLIGADQRHCIQLGAAAQIIAYADPGIVVVEDVLIERLRFGVTELRTAGRPIAVRQIIQIFKETDTALGGHIAGIPVGAGDAVGTHRRDIVNAPGIHLEMIHPLGIRLAQQIKGQRLHRRGIGAVHAQFCQAQYIIPGVSGDGEADIPTGSLHSRQPDQRRYGAAAGQHLPQQLVFGEQRFRIIG